MDHRNNNSWEILFQRLLEYRFKHGNFDIPSQYDVDPELSSWVTEQQKLYKSIPNKEQPRHTASLTVERENQLKLVGFDFEKVPTVEAYDDTSQEVCDINQEDRSSRQHRNSISPLEPSPLSKIPPSQQQQRHLIMENPSYSLASVMEFSAARRQMVMMNFLQYEQHLLEKLDQQPTPLPSLSTINPFQPVVETSEEKIRWGTSPEMENVTSLLPNGFAPGDYDVVCEKGKKFCNHIGNTRYRKAIYDRSKAYNDATNLERSFIVLSIVSEIRKKSTVGGFVKLNHSTGEWHRIAESAARLRTTHAFWRSLNRNVASCEAMNTNEELINGKKNQLATQSEYNNTKPSDEGSRLDDMEEAVVLPIDLELGEDDIIIGRGNRSYHHRGNKRFRNIVKSKITEYAAATSKVQKSNIVFCILSEALASSGPNNKGSRFMKRNAQTGRWNELDKYRARELTSQALRDAMGGYRSSVHIKRELRRGVLLTKKKTGGLVTAAPPSTTPTTRKRSFGKICLQIDDGLLDGLTSSRSNQPLRRVSIID